MNMNTSLGQGGASPPLKQHRTLKKKKNPGAFPPGGTFCAAFLSPQRLRAPPAPALAEAGRPSERRQRQCRARHLRPGLPRLPPRMPRCPRRGWLRTACGGWFGPPLPMEGWWWWFARSPWSPSPGFSLRLFFLHTSGSAEKVVANG